MDIINDAPGNVQGGFVAGNPETGTVPTSINARWLNAVQEEITNAIKAAELTPDINDNTQLSQAIKEIAGVSSNNTGSAGAGALFQATVHNAIGELSQATIMNRMELITQ